MSRLIDADALLDGIYSDNPKDVMLYIARFPTVEPRKGKWMFSPDHAEGVCTCCNYKIYGRPYQNTYLIVPYNYCPNCGARMSEGEEDETL